MGRKREEHDPDRFLQERAGRFHYKRRVPIEIGELDERWPVIRVSLETDDRLKARTKRDIHEAADNALWAAFSAGDGGAAVRARHKAAVKRAASLGFVYRPLADILANDPISMLADRVEATLGRDVASPVVDAALGGVERPDDRISQAVEFFVDTLARDTIRTKSPDQKRRWKNKKRLSVRNFISQATDKRMSEIDRADAQKFHGFWLDRVAPKEGKPTHSASSGNRDLGNMRTIYDAYYSHHGEPGRTNPFSGLSFADKSRRTRPPFPTAWIKDKILAPGALASLNDQARGIVLAFTETGARPGELCSLDETTIILAHDVPHIVVTPSDDPEEPREIKTESSIRIIPLVGVALAVFEKHPTGFPRYKDKGSQFSATANKHFKKNKLFPTPKHKVYSLRHSFEDRMKNALVDEELRKMLMGHTIYRPKYGTGGEMEMWRDQLNRIALPFDPSIV